MRVSKSLLFVLMSTFTASAHAGFDYGNGGDLLFCTDSPDSPFRGHYSLDYVMAVVNGNPLTPLVSVHNYRHSVSRIQRLLAAKYPALGESLGDFFRYHLNFSDTGQSRIWRRVVGFRPMPIADEELDAEALPANCLHRDGTPRLKQLIIRHQAPDKIIYDFAWAVLGTMATHPDPLQQTQASFIYIHEWLWDVLDSAAQIRQVNHFLHSQLLEQMSSAEVVEHLQNLGIPNPLPDPYQARHGQLLIGRYNPLAGGTPYYVVPNYRGERLLSLHMYQIEVQDSYPLCYIASANSTLSFRFHRHLNQVVGPDGVIDDGFRTSFNIVRDDGATTRFVLFPDSPLPLLDPCP